MLEWPERREEVEGRDWLPALNLEGIKFRTLHCPNRGVNTIDDNV